MMLAEAESIQVDDIQVDYVRNLHPVFTRPKRVKIVVGGRGSSKSTGISDYVLARVRTGELWCCARETQNSIEESVHRTLLDEIRVQSGSVISSAGVRRSTGISLAMSGTSRPSLTFAIRHLGAPLLSYTR